jgi:hypothetical protein
MTKVPFRVKGGLDANLERIQKVADPIEDTDAVNKSYVDSLEVASTNYVYASNAISVDENKPVSLTYTNGIFLTKIQSATEQVTFIIKFDRNTVTWNLPDIKYAWTSSLDLENVTWLSFFSTQEIQNIDYSQTIINNVGYGNSGTLSIENDKKTFSYAFTTNTLNDKYLVFKNTDNTFIVEVVTIQAPEITAANITSNYPNTQDQLRNTEQVTFTVTSDVNIYEVEINGTHYTSKIEYKGGTSKTETIITTVKDAPNNQEEGSIAYFNIRVKDVNNNWSNYYNSSTQMTPTNGTDYMVVCNTAPSFSGQTITYPSGKTGLDTNDIATVNFTVNYLGASGNVVCNDLSTNFSNINKVNNSQFLLTANSNVYRFNTNTAVFTATRVRNGQTALYNAAINIASLDMVIGNMSVNTFRSSELGFNTNFNITGTNQQIAARSITLNGAPSGLTLPNQGTISGTAVNNAQINVTDNVNKQIYSNLLVAQFTGISGRTVTKNFNITIKGFVQRTYSNLNLMNPIIIPNVVDTTKLIVGIGDANNLNNCTFFTPSVIEPLFQGDTANQVNEFYAYLNDGTWYIIFDNNVGALAGPGGWLSNARLVIEETL